MLRPCCYFIGHKERFEEFDKYESIIDVLIQATSKYKVNQTPRGVEDLHHVVQHKTHDVWLLLSKRGAWCYYVFSTTF